MEESTRPEGMNPVFEHRNFVQVLITTTSFVSIFHCQIRAVTVCQQLDLHTKTSLGFEHFHCLKFTISNLTTDNSAKINKAVLSTFY